MQGDRAEKFNQAMKLIEQGHRMLRELEDPNVIPLPKKAKPKKIVGPIDQFRGSEIIFKLLHDVTHDLQEKWLSTYPTVDIKTEMLKSDMWIATHPARAPKNYGRFFTAWLARAYESQRKNPVQRSLNEQGFYMTQAMKVSHNNQLQLQKIKETMNVEEREVNGADFAHGRVP